MDKFEADLKNKLIVHPSNPVMDWCAANVCAYQAGVSRRPVKPSKNGPDKIDIMVAALYAYAAAEKDPPPEPVPVGFFFI